MPSPGIKVIVCAIRFIIIARLQPPGPDELDAIAARVLENIARDEASPSDLVFLLRHYSASERDDIADALGEALAAALGQYALEPTVEGRASWLSLFCAAIECSDDERLQSAAGFLIGSLRRDDPRPAGVVEACASIEACLRASALGDAQEIVSEAVDELEHVIGHAYKPGAGIVGGDLRDHARAAATLLTAHEITGRLPYAMLAEELMQSAKRLAWSTSGFAANCEAARVLCRLAALHADEEYQRAAVIAADANYRADAARVLAAQAPHARGKDAAEFGLALGEYLALREPQDQP